MHPNTYVLAQVVLKSHLVRVSVFRGRPQNQSKTVAEVGCLGYVCSCVLAGGMPSNHLLCVPRTLSQSYSSCLFLCQHTPGLHVATQLYTCLQISSYQRSTRHRLHLSHTLPSGMQECWHHLVSHPVRVTHHVQVTVSQIYFKKTFFRCHSQTSLHPCTLAPYCASLSHYVSQLTEDHGSESYFTLPRSKCTPRRKPGRKSAPHSSWRARQHQHAW